MSVKDRKNHKISRNKKENRIKLDSIVKNRIPEMTHCMTVSLYKTYIELLSQRIPAESQVYIEEKDESH